jgi:hypothetical protein
VTEYAPVLGAVFPVSVRDPSFMCRIANLLGAESRSDSPIEKAATPRLTAGSETWLWLGEE